MANILFAIVRRGARMSKKRKMTEEEKLAWENLYNYVKLKIMGYDENQALSSAMVLRLKGLLSSKFMENNNIESKANYSYETILNTFKYSYIDIQKALRTNNWANEMHKFNYVLKIVEKNINTVYMKLKNIEKAKEEARNTGVEAITHTGAEFKPKENKKDKFTNLW
jgi:hypothetical protein